MSCTSALVSACLVWACLVWVAACGQATGDASGSHAATATADAVAPASQVRGHQSGVVDHVVESLDGQMVDLRSLRPAPLLIVNTASECGYTPQYEGLQQLWQRYADRGLMVLGFPSNDFGGQEPGSHEQIRSFCTTRFGVTFPLFAKIHTRGPEIAPLYRTLTEEGPEATRGEVRWNFTKFLVDAEGRLVARFEPDVEPLSPAIVTAIEKLLASGGVAGQPAG